MLNDDGIELCEHGRQFCAECHMNESSRSPAGYLLNQDSRRYLNTAREGLRLLIEGGALDNNAIDMRVAKAALENLDAVIQGT